MLCHHERLERSVCETGVDIFNFLSDLIQFGQRREQLWTEHNPEAIGHSESMTTSETTSGGLLCIGLFCGSEFRVGH